MQQQQETLKKLVVNFFCTQTPKHYAMSTSPEQNQVFLLKPKITQKRPNKSQTIVQGGHQRCSRCGIGNTIFQSQSSTRYPAIWPSGLLLKFGPLDFRLLTIRISGLWTSGFVDLRTSGNPDFWPSGLLAIQTFDLWPFRLQTSGLKFLTSSLHYNQNKRPHTMFSCFYLHLTNFLFPQIISSVFGSFFPFVHGADVCKDKCLLYKKPNILKISDMLNYS